MLLLASVTISFTSGPLIFKEPNRDVSWLSGWCLQKWNIWKGKEIVTLAKSSNYQLACQKHFDVTHVGHQQMAELAVRRMSVHIIKYFFMNHCRLKLAYKSELHKRNWLEAEQEGSFPWLFLYSFFYHLNLLHTFLPIFYYFNISYSPIPVSPTRWPHLNILHFILWYLTEAWNHWLGWFATPSPFHLKIW